MNETYYGKFAILDLRFLDQIPFNDPFTITISESVLTVYPQWDKIAFSWDGNDVNFKAWKDGTLLENVTGWIFIDNTLPVNPYGIGKIEFVSNGTPQEDIRNGLISGGYLRLDESVTTMFTYLMNSPKNQVTKSLNWVSTMEIKINRVINNKNLIVDIANIDEESKKRFNYVYLPFMKRYYYVQEINLMKDFTSCSLAEDVLMSFSDLIRLQTAFVERQEYIYDIDKTDDLIQYDFDKNQVFTTIPLKTGITIFTPTTATNYPYIITLVGKGA